MSYTHNLSIVMLEAANIDSYVKTLDTLSDSGWEFIDTSIVITPSGTRVAYITSRKLNSPLFPMRPEVDWMTHDALNKKL